MSAIVIRRRSAAERLGALVRGAIPERARRYFTGPVNRLVVEVGRSRVEQAAGRFRPVEVLVDPGIVLKRRLHLPPDGRGELRHAVELLVRSMTPFEPQELLIHAAADADQPGTVISYTLHMLPRDIVVRALNAARLRASAVRSIRIAPGIDTDRIDFASALTPSRRWRRWLAVLPLAVFLVAGLWVCSDRLGDLQTEEMRLEDQQSQLLAHVKLLTGRIDQSSSAAKNAQTAAAALASSQSAFLLLRDLRAAQPADIDLQRLDVRDDGARLTVRTPDALKDVKAFAAALADRTVSIEGTIAADPASGLETAVILIGPGK